MMASYNGRTDVVEMLLRPPGREVGADHTAKNNLGKTALEYAEQYGTAKSILLRSRAPSRRGAAAPRQPPCSRRGGRPRGAAPPGAPAGPPRAPPPPTPLPIFVSSSRLLTLFP